MVTGRRQEAGFGKEAVLFLDVVCSASDDALNYTFVVFKLCGRSHTSVKNVF